MLPVATPARGGRLRQSSPRAQSAALLPHSCASQDTTFIHSPKTFCNHVPWNVAVKEADSSHCRNKRRLSSERTTNGTGVVVSLVNEWSQFRTSQSTARSRCVIANGRHLVECRAPFCDFIFSKLEGGHLSTVQFEQCHSEWAAK